MKTLAVVMNWRRPQNMERVMHALRSQSVPLTIAIVECSPESPFECPSSVRDRADIVFSIDHNIGPCSRFIPPLAMPEHRYTFFGVDDHAPGPRHVEWLLQCVTRLHNTQGDGDHSFATIGQDGRIVRDGAIVHRKTRMVEDSTVPVDVITSSELVPTARIQDVLKFRDALLEEHPGISTFEDDLFLCAGAQVRCRQVTGDDTPCYLTPDPPSKDESWRAAKLPSPHALCARPDHHAKRDHWVQCAIQCGWRPASQSA